MPQVSLACVRRPPSRFGRCSCGSAAHSGCRISRGQPARPARLGRVAIARDVYNIHRCPKRLPEKRLRTCARYRGIPPRFRGRMPSDISRGPRTGENRHQGDKGFDAAAMPSDRDKGLLSGRRRRCSGFRRLADPPPGWSEPGRTEVPKISRENSRTPSIVVGIVENHIGDAALEMPWHNSGRAPPRAAEKAWQAPPRREQQMVSNPPQANTFKTARVPAGYRLRRKRSPCREAIGTNLDLRDRCVILY